MPNSPSNIGIITSTYYPSNSDPIQQVRARLAIYAIRSAASMGFPVTIVDGGSDPTIFPVHNLGARVITSDDSDMVFTRQLVAELALQISPNVTHLIWTEPEKDISLWVISWVERALDEQAAVLIPMRLHMESYPLHQQVSERLGNEQLGEIFARDLGDHYFGPRVFRRDAVVNHWLRDFNEYKTAQRRWASIYGPVFGALATGERVVGLPVDFAYPAEQNTVEANVATMIAKRRQQREVITQTAIDIRDNLPWHPEWNIVLLDGYSLQNQTMDVIDLAEKTAASA